MTAFDANVNQHTAISVTSEPFSLALRRMQVLPINSINSPSRTLEQMISFICDRIKGHRQFSEREYLLIEILQSSANRTAANKQQPAPK